MKRPHQGIRSTTKPQLQQPPSDQHVPPVQAAPILDNDSWLNNLSVPSLHLALLGHGPYVIKDDDSSIDNIFYFSVFVDKRTGILYNDTGTFPYMSLEGNACFLIIYHYNSNTILALPISGLGANTFFCSE